MPGKAYKPKKQSSGQSVGRQAIQDAMSTIKAKKPRMPGGKYTKGRAKTRK